jgi:CxxC motif-containing protein (DUF1111 family)
LFSGEAYNVEMGVTNELFPNERSAAPHCTFNHTPEDHLVFEASPDSGGGTSGMQNFATFMRLLAPPAPASETPTVIRGKNIFSGIGCALCHTATLMTAASDLDGLDQKPANLYSDLLVHNMGAGLADGIRQGLAGPDEFRTAPLWGVGQRLFFLHDGRASELLTAIRAHRGQNSEANTVIRYFEALSERQIQDLLNFLRSL